MNQKFEVNGIYEFDVVSKVELPSGKKHFLLRHSGVEGYKVMMFPAQENPPLPRTIKCRVKELKPNGDVYLHQDKKSFWESLYRVGQEYPFVLASGADMEKDQNGSGFFRIEDEYGNVHRYYPKTGEPKPEDLFHLRIKEITDTHVSFWYREIPVEGDVETIQGPDSLTVRPAASYSGVGLPEGIEEDERTEFKSSIVFTAGTTEPDIDTQLEVIVRTIAAFMNTGGGSLYIGINNNGIITGINQDLPYLNSTSRSTVFDPYPENRDGYEQCIRNAVRMHLSSFANAKLKMRFLKGSESNLVFVEISIPALHRPVFFKGTLLYQRAGNGNQLLKGDNITSYIEDRLQHKPAAGEVHSVSSVKPDEQSEELKPLDIIPLIPASLLPVSSNRSSKVWKYITLLSNGGWSFGSKTNAHKETTLHEVAITQHEKEEGCLMLMCYDNGRINVVKPQGIIRDRRPNKEYSNGYSRNAELKKIILARPYDLIAVYSLSQEGTAMVKLHKAADFGQHEAIYAMGNTALSDRFGKVTGYQKVSAEYSSALSGLLETKARTTLSAGIALSNEAHLAEMDLLKTLPGYPFISNA
jgi:hypothetical protein